MTQTEKEIPFNVQILGMNYCFVKEISIPPFCDSFTVLKIGGQCLLPGKQQISAHAGKHDDTEWIRTKRVTKATKVTKVTKGPFLLHSPTESCYRSPGEENAEERPHQSLCSSAAPRSVGPAMFAAACARGVFPNGNT